MLKPMDDLPDGIIGFEAHGKLKAHDYEAVLIPAVLTALEDGKMRFLFVLADDFAGFELGAVWDDAVFGLRHYFDFEKIAVVTSSSVMAAIIHSVAFMIPAETHVFKMENLDKATAWLAYDKDFTSNSETRHAAL